MKGKGKINSISGSGLDFFMEKENRVDISFPITSEIRERALDTLPEFDNKTPAIIEEKIVKTHISFISARSSAINFLWKSEQSNCEALWAIKIKGNYWLVPLWNKVNYRERGQIYTKPKTLILLKQERCYEYFEAHDPTQLVVWYKSGIPTDLLIGDPQPGRDKEFVWCENPNLLCTQTLPDIPF